MRDENVVLRLEGICKEFPGVKALQNVEFTLRKGEIHALMGENGDYNDYAVTETKTVDGKTLTCKGNDGLVSNATWTDGTYAYSIMSTLGMTAEQLSTFVQSLS